MKNKIEDALEAINYGANNTCAEAMLGFIAEKLGKKLLISSKDSMNDYQPDLGSAITPFIPLVPTAGAIIVERANAVQAKIFYAGNNPRHHSELCSFLDEKCCYFVRTGTNSGTGHWSALFYNKDTETWELKSSPSRAAFPVIGKDGFREGAEDCGICGKETEKWGMEGDERSLQLIEVNERSFNTTLEYVRGFRTQVLEANASIAGTEAISQYIEKRDTDVARATAQGLEAEWLGAKASEIIEVNPRWQAVIEAWKKDALTNPTQIQTSINLDRILFAVKHDLKNQFTNEEAFIGWLNGLDINKIYFVRCGKKTYEKSSDKPALDLFYYDANAGGWQCFKDNVTRPILSAGSMDVTMSGKYVNGEHYWKNNFFDFLEITPDILERILQFIYSIRTETAAIISVSEYQNSAAFSSEVKKAEETINSETNRKKRIQDILEEASATRERLEEIKQCLVENISQKHSEFTPEEKLNLEGILKERSDRIFKKAQEEADLALKGSINKTARDQVTTTYKKYLEQNFEPICQKHRENDKTFQKSELLAWEEACKQINTEDSQEQDIKYFMGSLREKSKGLNGEENTVGLFDETQVKRGQTAVKESQVRLLEYWNSQHRQRQGFFRSNRFQSTSKTNALENDQRDCRSQRSVFG